MAMRNPMVADGSGPYKTLYQHALATLEVEERAASRLQVRINFLLTVITAALGLGLFRFLSDIAPELATQLDSDGQTIVVSILISTAAGCLVASYLFLFEVLPLDLLMLNDGDFEEPGALGTLADLHLDADLVDPEMLPKFETNAETVYAQILVDTEETAFRLHEKNLGRDRQVKVAQDLLGVGLAVLLVGFICYSLMQGTWF